MRAVRILVVAAMVVLGLLWFRAYHYNSSEHVVTICTVTPNDGGYSIKAVEGDFAIKGQGILDPNRPAVDRRLQIKKVPGTYTIRVANEPLNLQYSDNIVAAEKASDNAAALVACK